MNKDIEILLKEYDKRFIKVGNETDFMFQRIFPLYRRFDGYDYPVNTKSWDNYLYIKTVEWQKTVEEWYEYFDEEDKKRYREEFKLVFH